jgi:nuclear pore complex protein Nup98-Nup96
MVRFTAHTSDLSDSDSEQEDVFTAQRRPSTTSQPQRQPQRQSQRQSQRQRQSQDSQRQEHSDDSSSTSSDLHEEELAPPPPPRKKRPTRTAFVEDENGRSSSPQPHRHPNPATPWAQQVGVDAQRMQLMQVSMFRMPEDAATLKAMSEPKRTSILIDKALRRKHSRGSDGDPLRAESHEVCLLRRTSPCRVSSCRVAANYLCPSRATSALSTDAKICTRRLRRFRRSRKRAVSG